MRWRCSISPKFTLKRAHKYSSFLQDHKKKYTKCHEWLKAVNFTPLCFCNDSNGWKAAFKLILIFIKCVRNFFLKLPCHSLLFELTCLILKPYSEAVVYSCSGWLYTGTFECLNSQTGMQIHTVRLICNSINFRDHFRCRAVPVCNVMSEEGWH